MWLPTESGIKCCNVAGGRGNLALAFTRRFPNSHFTICGINDAALDKGKDDAARQGVSNVSFVNKDISELPGEWIAKFDFLTMVHALHDMTDPVSTVNSLYKMLKPGCCLILCDVKCDSDPRLTIRSIDSAYSGPSLYAFSLYH